jgi:hypothetical protein
MNIFQKINRIILVMGFTLAVTRASALTPVAITFSELSERPLHGVSLSGVTFGFSGTGGFYPMALFGATEPSYGSSALMNAPWAIGGTSGELTLQFSAAVFSLSFDVGLTSSATLPSGFSVRLYYGNGSRGTFNMPTEPLMSGPFAFSEGHFSYSGAAITSAKVAFDATTAENFALDNLNFTIVPEPTVLNLLLAGLGMVSFRGLRLRS